MCWKQFSGVDLKSSADGMIITVSMVPQICQYKTTARHHDNIMKHSVPASNCNLEKLFGFISVPVLININA